MLDPSDHNFSHLFLDGAHQCLAPGQQLHKSELMCHIKIVMHHAAESNAVACLPRVRKASAWVCQAQRKGQSQACPSHWGSNPTWGLSE